MQEKCPSLSEDEVDVAVESSVYYQATLFFDKRNISQIISIL